MISDFTAAYGCSPVAFRVFSTRKYHWPYSPFKGPWMGFPPFFPKAGFVS